MRANAVEVRGLEKTFPSFRLGPLDLTVPAGAIYGLVGPNGSGKTTTIDLIFGMGTKDAGSIRLLGLDHLEDEVAVKRQVAYVGPDLVFQPWGRVGRVIQFVRGFYPTWDQAYCERLMRSLDLGAGDRIMTLSFGARIKLALPPLRCWASPRSSPRRSSIAPRSGGTRPTGAGRPFLAFRCRTRRSRSLSSSV